MAIDDMCVLAPIAYSISGLIYSASLLYDTIPRLIASYKNKF